MRTPSTALLALPIPSAVERLDVSRALLRQALLKGTYTPPPGTRADAASPPSAWMDSLRSIPLANVLIEAIGSWWTQHPLRIACILAADTTKAIVQPMARRNPLGVALGAVLLGGLLVWGRPWRWILKPALFAGLSTQLLSKGIAHLPLQSWMTTLVTALQARKPEPAPPPTETRTNRPPIR